MVNFVELLKSAPSEAWMGLLGVLFGSLLTTLGVFFTNRSSTKQLKMQLQHSEKIQNDKISKERLEELYILVCHWSSLILSDYLKLRLVINEHTDYNQYLDGVIKSNEEVSLDFNRIEMIIGIYGKQLTDAYAKVIEARDFYNKISAEHKASYRRGENGLRFLEPLSDAALSIQDKCNLLKLDIANAARNA